MKKKSIVAAALAMFCMAVSCSKKDTVNQPEVPDVDTVINTNCILSGVTFPNGPAGSLPYYKDPSGFEYDSLGRVVRHNATAVFETYVYEADRYYGRVYSKNEAQTLLTGETYVLDAQQRVDYLLIDNYSFSQGTITATDSIDFQYDAEGYLISRNRYQNKNPKVVEGYTYTYAGGNLVERKLVSDFGGVDDPRTDVWKYTYDTSAYIPATRFLYELGDDLIITIGKPNKNNVKTVACTFFYGEMGADIDLYKQMNYSYIFTGNNLSRVELKASIYKGANINTYFGFSYNCK